MKRSILFPVLVLTTLHAQDFRRVQRQEPLPPPQVTIIEERGLRVVRANGIPNHATGQFPNPGNPNSIMPQRYEFRMTLRPKAASKPTPSGHSFFGVAVSGIPFEPGTAEFWNGDRAWNYEALSGQINLGIDDSQAHVQPNGAYHYHGLPKGLTDTLGGDTGTRMLLVGWAADGFPIYTAFAHQTADDATSPLVPMKSSYQLKTGARAGGPGGSHDGTFTADYEYIPGSGDLDECHGRTGVTPEYPEGIYYYCITAEFPHLARQWKGTPDKSFEKQGPPGRGGPRRGRRGGPGFGPPPPPPGFGPPPPGFGPPPN